MRLLLPIAILVNYWTSEIAADSSQTATSEEIAQTIAPVFAYNLLDTIRNPMQMGAMPSRDISDSSRHRQEKAHLMKRMDRKNGKWNSSHPRYRLLDALFSYSKYRDSNIAELDRWRNLYKNVGKQQKKTLDKAVNYKQKLDDVEELIYENFMVCKSIVSNAMQFYDVTQKELHEHIKEAEKSGRNADRISVSQALKHFVRDWSNEGSKERNDAFPCIIDVLENIKAQTREEKPVKVLLPGAGLGRLGHEIAQLGDFEVTMNEWSMYMNLAYRYVNDRTPEDYFAIHPFIDGMSHHAKTSDMLRKIIAPDSTPSSSVLLVEGDFNTAFKEQGGQYDIIVTHYFIDTARNLMSYFDTIRFLLKNGGKWVNFGPLLYGTAPFVQLSLDEIIAVVEEMGFEFEELSDECGELTFEDKKVRTKESGYGFNGKALTKNAYAAQAWVARKR